MIDYLFHVALNNVCISFILAIVAAIIGSTLKRPVITHILWLLVFVKLLIPPVVTLSAVSIPSIIETAHPVSPETSGQQEISITIPDKSKDATFSAAAIKSDVFHHGKKLLFLLWLSGSMVIFTRSIFQVFRFHQLLKKESGKAPHEIQSIAAQAASCLGLETAPLIRTTSANISPMVWWTGGRLWLVIPAALIEQMDSRQIRLILSHELAHISRWDYMCRWIEWVAFTCFWWNPVVWWARYNLHASEEICCDALVLSSMKPEPYIYGDTLIKAIDILLCTPRFQMVMASNFNGGDLLKRRLKIIISKNQGRSRLRWLNACILAAALFMLPLGFMQAKVNDNDTDQLEGHLNAIEKEIDRSGEKLSDELSKRDGFKKAYEQYSKNLTSNPAFQKNIRDSIIQSMAKGYDPLFKKLNISKEKFDEFKCILVERMDEIQNTVIYNSMTASDVEKTAMKQKRMEINNKYKDRVNDFLGEENSKIYVSFLMRLPERSSLNYFMDTIPPDNRIGEEEVEILIDSMYAARKAIYDEMGPDIDTDSSSDLTEENIAREIEKTKRVYEKYVEESRAVLPVDQVQNFEAHLKRNLDMTESTLKTRFFMNDN